MLHLPVPSPEERAGGGEFMWVRVWGDGKEKLCEQEIGEKGEEKRTAPKTSQRERTVISFCLYLC